MWLWGELFVLLHFFAQSATSKYSDLQIQPSKSQLLRDQAILKDASGRRRKRQSDNPSANLEYVMSVLSKQGLLNQVDPNLLRRIQGTINKKNSDNNSQQGDSASNTNSNNLLDVNRQRHQRLFGSRAKNRLAVSQVQNQRTPSRKSKTSQQNPFGSTRFNKIPDDSLTCQALKTENRILKQQLLKSDQQKQAPVTAVDVLKRLQDQGHFNTPSLPVLPGGGPVNPLEKLLQNKEGENDARHNGITLDYGGVQIKSVLITPSPTISTITETSRFVTTETVNLTKEIGIFFHGKRIPTHIIEQEVQVRTATSIQSRTVEVTPTPTWQTITVTPTVTPPPTPPTLSPALLQKQQQEIERQQLLERIQRLKNNPKPPQTPRNFGGFKAEVVEIPEALENFSSLQNYIQVIRQQNQKQEADNQIHIRAEPLIAEPQEPVSATATTSISTVYLSGSVPGEFSTSLVTITLGEEQETFSRRFRRDSSPVIMTRLPSLQEHLLEPELISSFSARNSEDQCEGTTVTVTVTSTGKCHDSYS